MNLDKLFETLVLKTNEGIEKLKTVEIGTEQYQILMSQILSNVNLFHERNILENGKPNNQPPKQFDPQSVIGKEFK